MLEYIKLDWFTKSEIVRLSKQESMTVEELAYMFGIPESYVGLILRGKA